MKKYRIVEKTFEDGHKEFHPQYLDKVLSQNHCYTDGNVHFDSHLGWVSLLKTGCFANNMEEANIFIKNDKQKNSPLVAEVIHEIE